MFSFNSSEIIPQIVELERQFRVFLKQQNITQMFKVLYAMRVLHGNILHNINKLNTNVTDVTKHDSFYKISLLTSMIKTIEEVIKDTELSISKFQEPTDPVSIVNYIDNSNSVFLPVKKYKIKNNNNNELSLESENRVSENPPNFSESSDEQDTEDLLRGNVQNTDANTYNNNVSNNNASTNSLNLGNEKSYMILFFAPWCGWSQRFLPIWNEFKEKMSNNSKLKIVTINSERRPEYVQKFNVSGFPTIKLLKPNEQPIEFKQERTLANLLQFVNKYIK